MRAARSAGIRLIAFGVTRPRLVGAGAVASLLLALGATVPVDRKAPSWAASNPEAAIYRDVVDRYCVRCHDEKRNAGNLRLDRLDLIQLGTAAETGEKVVRKLRAGMMPPTGRQHPDARTREALIAWLEGELDRAAVPNLPPPGLHRLNRTEYANAIRDLLDLRVDAAKFLPSDDSTHGFDNMAGTLGMSPALVEAYLSAAGKVSRLALGDVSAPTQTGYDAPADTAQNYHIEGLPLGTRGGMRVEHQFPADGEYIIRVLPIAGYFKFVLGGIKGEQLEVLIDGERVKLFDWDKEIGTGRAGRIGETPRIAIKAGLHTVGVTFLATNEAPGSELNKPFVRTMNAPGQLPGYLFYPHVGQIQIEGPYAASGAQDSPSRRRIFLCRPASAAEEQPCAERILGTLARRAYRRPVRPEDLATLVRFYEAGRADGDFDSGIEAALQRILADPEFVYRGEMESGAPGEAYAISDLALASRLSFFLWSSIPDDELLSAAERGLLRNPTQLAEQVRRMIADPRSAALIENFAGQWLNVRGMQAVEPAVNLFPDFDSNLRDAFRSEIALFVESIVREDRSVLELLTADYTFVNERLAKHYGIPGVYGSQFRRVELGPELDMRRGLLGKGALLTVTSQATRTSPVLRGKWFLQTFLGVSPPDPPPNVPTIQERKHEAAASAVEPSMRQRMEMHRTNPACATCHVIFEPLGLAMENYDATGMWRTADSGSPVDASGQFVDGSPLDGPASLRALLLRYQDQYVRTLTEKLLTYALGRGVEYEDMPVVRKIVRDAVRSEYRFSSLLTGIVTSAPFQMNRRAGQGEQTAARR